MKTLEGAGMNRSIKHVRASIASKWSQLALKHSPRQGACFSAQCVTFLLLLGLPLLGGCSIKKVALRQVGNALSGTGSTFSAENDPQLVREALPFSLKLMDGLLAEIPDHKPLVIAATSAYVQYAFAFLQMDADRLESTDFEAAQALRSRAANLFLRARDYGLGGMELKRPGWVKRLAETPLEASHELDRDDVALAYWTGAAWAGLINLSKEQPHRIAEIPQMEVLMDRVLELDEGWNDGAIHAFMITYAFARQGTGEDPAEAAKYHYRKALELSEGRQIGPHVSLAESLAVQTQDSALFEELLRKATAFDVNTHPETRLVNLLMQQRAHWLLDHETDLILPALEDLPPIE